MLVYPILKIKLATCLANKHNSAPYGVKVSPFCKLDFSLGVAEALFKIVDSLSLSSLKIFVTMKNQSNFRHQYIVMFENWSSTTSNTVLSTVVNQGFLVKYQETVSNTNIHILANFSAHALYIPQSCKYGSFIICQTFMLTYLKYSNFTSIFQHYLALLS